MRRDGSCDPKIYGVLFAEAGLRDFVAQALGSEDFDSNFSSNIDPSKGNEKTSDLRAQKTGARFTIETLDGAKHSHLQYPFYWQAAKIDRDSAAKWRKRREWFLGLEPKPSIATDDVSAMRLIKPTGKLSCWEILQV